MNPLVLLLATVILMTNVPTVIATDPGAWEFVNSVSVSDDNYLYIEARSDFVDRKKACADPKIPAMFIHHPARSKHQISDERTRAMMRIALVSLITGKAVRITTDGCVGVDTGEKREPTLGEGKGSIGAGGASSFRYLQFVSIEIKDNLRLPP